MKNRNWKAPVSALLAAMLLLTGCGPAASAETTVPTETTAPVETTPPPETTGPAETTMQTEPVETLPIMDGPEKLRKYLESQGFVHTEDLGYDENEYLYTGDKGEVFMEDLGLTLTIPEDWVDQVEILRYWYPGADSQTIYVVNRALAEDYHGYLTHMAYAVQIHAVRKMNNDRADPYGMINTKEYGRISNYLGSNNEYDFYFTTAEMSGGMDTPMFWKYFIVVERGLDYYAEIIGDLIADPAEIPGWVAIHDTPEEFVAEKPAETLEEYPDFEWLGVNELYRYTGESGVIDFPELGFTLTIPENWLGKVEVIINVGAWVEFDLYVLSKDVSAAFVEHNIRNPYVFAYETDFILNIYYGVGLDQHDWILQGRDECTLSAETREMAMDHDGYSKLEGYGHGPLREAIGEEALNELLNEFVLDEVLLRQMITLHNGNEIELAE